VPVSREKVELLVRKHTNGETTLSFERFSDLLMPLSRHYSLKVRDRPSSRDARLPRSTLLALVDLFKLMADNEREIVDQKVALTSRVTWN